MAFLGDAGQTYNAPVIGGFMGNVTATYGSWGNMNTTYYKWTLNDAGTYELHASLRTRVWNTTGFPKFVPFRVSDSNRNSDMVRMGVEFQNSGVYNNTQQHFVWVVTTTTDNDTYYLQFQASANNAGLSVQSDANGYNQCWWRRLS